MKTVYMIWCKDLNDEGPCFLGKDVFWSTDYTQAIELKSEIEYYRKDLNPRPSYDIISSQVKD